MMNKAIKRKFFFAILTAIFINMLSNQPASAQTDARYMRIAKIVVDSAQLDDYKAALKEGITAAVCNEPGVLSLSAVYDKMKPTHVTVFEIYASEEAYKLHTQTPHFKKYKSAVANMVISLQLTDVAPIALEAKPEMMN